MRERFTVEPRDVPARTACCRLSLTEVWFNRIKLELFARGFPRPDPTTGMYDLKKIDAWMDSGTEDPLPLDPIEFERRLAALPARKRRRE